jgi:hypothetical protein
VIELYAETFPWAHFRRTKGAVKLHFTLDHDGYLPTFLVITDGSIAAARWPARGRSASKTTPPSAYPVCSTPFAFG